MMFPLDALRITMIELTEADGKLHMLTLFCGQDQCRILNERERQNIDPANEQCWATLTNCSLREQTMHPKHLWEMRKLMYSPHAPY